MRLEPRGSANHLQLRGFKGHALLRNCLLLAAWRNHRVLFQLSTAAISATLNFRDFPLAKSPSSSPPIATRTGRKVGRVGSGRWARGGPPSPMFFISVDSKNGPLLKTRNLLKALFLTNRTNL